MLDITVVKIKNTQKIFFQVMPFTQNINLKNFVASSLFKELWIGLCQGYLGDIVGKRTFYLLLIIYS